MVSFFHCVQSGPLCMCVWDRELVEAPKILNPQGQILTAGQTEP